MAVVLPPAQPAVIALPVSISLGKIRSALSAQVPAADSLTGRNVWHWAAPYAINTCIGAIRSNFA